MKDLKFAKDKVTCDFEEAENLENIQSGESIGTIFGKIQKWISDIGSKYFSVQEIVRRINESDKKISQNADNITKSSNQLKELKSDIDDGAIGVFRKWHDDKGNVGGLVRKDCISTATGMCSISLGESSSASGMYSTTCGFSTSATSYCCSAFGFGTVAAAHSQFAFGRYNEINYSDHGYVLIIGNGNSDNARSNAFTLDWNGNLWTAGDVTATDSDANKVSLCEIKALMENILERVEKLESISEITNEKIDEIMEG